ncbi:hypothetical protein HAX54_025342 [Datura stramonium]|uniref:Uncharacterized protein n=1 Tax=Datura stramonium TaxID=4076 RepID=A0ABS8UZE2_DATST|nr:hypothetical protein [Datura stramonium]
MAKNEMKSTLKGFDGIFVSYGFRNILVHRVSTYQKGNHREDFRWKRLFGGNGHGSGKSLCYQVPPLISEKTAVVINYSHIFDARSGDGIETEGH